jgi:copper chaperone CopZ
MNNLIVRFVLATLAAVVMFSSINAFAKEHVTKEVQIKTSAFSEMCKNKIESILKDKKGVEDSYLSMDDKIVTITYNPDLVKPEDLQKSIKELGYDADIVNPDENKAESKVEKPAKMN